MNAKRILPLIFLSVAVSVSAQIKKKTTSNKVNGPVKQETVASTDLPRPKLVVEIVVDQMRWDYLYRYYSRYGNGGFKRLLNEGFSCENTNIDYVRTVRAAGHTAAYPGSVPALHGIAANDCTIYATGKAMSC